MYEKDLNGSTKTIIKFDKKYQTDASWQKFKENIQNH